MMPSDPKEPGGELDIHKIERLLKKYASSVVQLDAAAKNLHRKENAQIGKGNIGITQGREEAKKEDSTYEPTEPPPKPKPR